MVEVSDTSPLRFRVRSCRRYYGKIAPRGRDPHAFRRQFYEHADIEPPIAPSGGENFARRSKILLRLRRFGLVGGCQGGGVSPEGALGRAAGRITHPRTATTTTIQAAPRPTMASVIHLRRLGADAGSSENAG